jgi:hypothetical protein
VTDGDNLSPPPNHGSVCGHRTLKGGVCQNPRALGTDGCIRHSSDPGVRKRAEDASNAGGETTKKLLKKQRRALVQAALSKVIPDAGEETTPAEISTSPPPAALVPAASRVLWDTIGLVRVDAMRPTVANSIFYGVSVVIKLGELELDERISRLEKLLEGRR